MTAPSAIRTTRCRHCKRKVVAAHLDNPPSQPPLPTPRSGRFDFERVPREIAVEDLRWHCYLIQPNPEHAAELVAFQLRPMQVPGAREHRQRIYRLHYCPTSTN